MGGWILRNSRFKKSSYIAHNDLYACQPSETLFTKNQEKKKKRLKRNNNESKEEMIKKGRKQLKKVRKS
jgi:hypothetical protein